MTGPSSQHRTNITTFKKIKGAPDYDDASYWDAKFITGQDPGEWLNEGVVLIDTAIRELEWQHSNCSNEAEEISQKQIPGPRALHLGPGISSLGDKLYEAFVQRNWKGSDIFVWSPYNQSPVHVVESIVVRCLFSNSLSRSYR